MINVNLLTKKELVQFMTNRCRHSHLYCAHPNCWVQEKNKTLKVGFIDIETSNLNANFGIILTYAIKTFGKDEVLTGQITLKDRVEGNFDKNVCKQLVQDMRKYDVLMGYYSTKYDIPFMRSRCLHNGVDFPVFQEVDHKDLYYMVKRLLKLHRNSLEVATKFLGISGKNHVHGKQWNEAVMCEGEVFNKAMKYIIDHNIRDVKITEKLYIKLRKFDRGIVKSI